MSESPAPPTAPNGESASSDDNATELEQQRLVRDLAAEVVDLRTRLNFFQQEQELLLRPTIGLPFSQWHGFRHQQTSNVGDGISNMPPIPPVPSPIESDIRSREAHYIDLILEERRRYQSRLDLIERHRVTSLSGMTRPSSIGIDYQSLAGGPTVRSMRNLNGTSSSYSLLSPPTHPPPLSSMSESLGDVYSRIASNIRVRDELWGGSRGFGGHGYDAYGLSRMDELLLGRQGGLGGGDGGLHLGYPSRFSFLGSIPPASSDDRAAAVAAAAANHTAATAPPTSTHEQLSLTKGYHPPSDPDTSRYESLIPSSSSKSHQQQGASSSSQSTAGEETTSLRKREKRVSDSTTVSTLMEDEEEEEKEEEEDETRIPNPNQRRKGIGRSPSLITRGASTDSESTIHCRADRASYGGCGGPVVRSKKYGTTIKPSPSSSDDVTMTNGENRTKSSSSTIQQQPPILVPPVSKRKLPLNFVPSPHTVVLGKGNGPKVNPGNIWLKRLVMNQLDEYVRGERREKIAIISNVIHHVMVADATGRAGTGAGAGFVKYEDDIWWEVTERDARVKVTALFRDCLHDKYRSSSTSKVRRRQLLRGQANGDNNNGNSNSNNSNRPVDVVDDDDDGNE